MVITVHQFSIYMTFRYIQFFHPHAIKLSLIFNSYAITESLVFNPHFTKVSSIFNPHAVYVLVPVAARSNAEVCGRLPAGIVGLNPAGGIDVSFQCCVLSSRGLCDGLITRLEKSYRMWCVIAFDLETSIMTRPWFALGRSATGGCC
jgi:hypothetical protein